MEESHSIRNGKDGGGVVHSYNLCVAGGGEEQCMISGVGDSKIEAAKGAFKILELLLKEPVFEVENERKKRGDLSESDSLVNPVKSNSTSEESVCPPARVLDNAVHCKPRNSPNDVDESEVVVERTLKVSDSAATIVGKKGNNISNIQRMAEVIINVCEIGADISSVKLIGKRCEVSKAVEMIREVKIKSRKVEVLSDNLENLYQ